MTSSSRDPLKSRLLVAFFAFVFGALVATLIHKKTAMPYQKAELFELFQTHYFIENLPPELADTLAEHLDQSNARTRALIDVAVYNAFLDARAQKPEKIRPFEDMLQSMEVSDEEIENFWERNQSRIKQPYYEARELIRNHLFQTKLHNQLQILIQKLLESGELDLNPAFYKGTSEK